MLCDVGRAVRVICDVWRAVRVICDSDRGLSMSQSRPKRIRIQFANHYRICCRSSKRPGET